MHKLYSNICISLCKADVTNGPYRIRPFIGSWSDFERNPYSFSSFLVHDLFDDWYHN